MKIIKQIYSINFDKFERSSRRIVYVVFHYTGMVSEKRAIERLANKNSKVSCHYFIKRDGTIINMVPDKFVAWHAGLSFWKSHKNLNNRSIGIEIQNSGHTNKYERFSSKQIKSILSLSKILKKKYNIKSKNFLGHSDIAPNRKKDPGEKFPWEKLAKANLAIWHKLSQKNNIKLRLIKLNRKEEINFIKNLYLIGYNKMRNLNSNLNKIYLVTAFQRRFRQSLINGKSDKECLEISKNLLKLKK